MQQSFSASRSRLSISGSKKTGYRHACRNLSSSRPITNSRQRKLKVDPDLHAKIIGGRTYTMRPFHPEDRPQGTFHVKRPPVTHKIQPPKASPTRDWILAKLEHAPLGLTAVEIRSGSKLLKGAFDAMLATLIRTSKIRIDGHRAPAGGGRVARVYRLIQTR